MSRIILSNNNNWAEYLTSNIEGSGFETNFKGNILYNSEPVGYLTTFKKLHVDNCNYFEKNREWVATSGTFVYKGLLGQDALKVFLEDAKQKSIKELRACSEGMYVVLYQISNCIYAFVDETQSCRFHYFYDGINYILTNEAVHMYKLLNPEIYIPAAQLCLHIENFTAKNSMFKNIYRLMADEYIKIDLQENKFFVEKAELNYYKYEFKTREEALNIITDKIKEHAKIRNNIFKDVTIYQTGGTDSRLVLATYKGIKPKLIYMHGNNFILPTKLEDSVICRKLSSKMDLDLKIYDLSSDCFIDYINTDSKNYWRDGDSITCLGNNSKFKNNILNQVSSEFCDFGYYGEMFRQFDQLNLFYKEPFTLNDFVEKLFFNNLEQVKCFNDISEVRGELYDIFLRHAKNMNMDITNLLKDDCFALWSYRRSIVDLSLPKITNLTRYSYPILGQKEIYDLINQVPYLWKKDAWLQLSLIQNLNPDCLNIPFFSHCKPCIFNKADMSLIPDEKFKFVKSIKSNGKILKSYMKNKDYNKSLLQFIISECSETFNKIHMKIASTKQLFSYGEFLYMNKLISNNAPETTTKKIINMSYQKTMTGKNIKIYSLSYKSKTLINLIEFKFAKNKITYIYILDKYLFKIVFKKIIKFSR